MDYLVWKDYTPGHEYASVQAEEGIAIEQIQDVRWARRLEPPPERVTITTLTPGEVPEVMSSGWGGRYVSQAAKRILEKHCGPGEVQFIPVAFAPHLGKRGRSYWLLNVTASEAFMDRERSDYEAAPRAAHVVKVVRRMVLQPIPEDAPALFHMAELPSVLLIREDLSSALAAGVRTPGRFERVEEYTRGLY